MAVPKHLVFLVRRNNYGPVLLGFVWMTSMMSIILSTSPAAAGQRPQRDLGAAIPPFAFGGGQGGGGSSDDEPGMAPVGSSTSPPQRMVPSPSPPAPAPPSGSAPGSTGGDGNNNDPAIQEAQEEAASLLGSTGVELSGTVSASDVLSLCQQLVDTGSLDFSATVTSSSSGKSKKEDFQVLSIGGCGSSADDVQALVAGAGSDTSALICSSSSSECCLFDATASSASFHTASSLDDLSASRTGKMIRGATVPTTGARKQSGARPLDRPARLFRRISHN